MKVTPLKRTLKANALTNPNPSFVSQVKAGANQEGYLAVRMDAAVQADDTTEAPKMKIRTKASASVAAIAPKGYGVMQFAFTKGEQFADEAAVKAWLDQGGYIEYEVVETSKSFEVSNDASLFEPASIQRIDGPVPGLAVFVGKLTDPDADPVAIVEDDEPAATETTKGAEGEEQEAAAEPEAETTTKADDAPAAEAAPVIDPPARKRAAGTEGSEEPIADDVTAAEPTAKAEGEDEPAAPAPVEKAEGEGVQPGAEEAPAQTDGERAKSMVEEIGQRVATKGVYEAAELGRIVNQLGWIVYDADYSGLSDATVTKIKTAANALLDAFMEASTDAADQLSEVFRSAEERAAKSAAPAAPEAPAPDATVDVTAIARAAATEAVAALQPELTAAREAATQANERAEKAERMLAERVEADNARGQTRKGAEEPITPVGTQTTEKKRSDASNNILSSFGSRHARN